MSLWMFQEEENRHSWLEARRSMVFLLTIERKISVSVEISLAGCVSVLEIYHDFRYRKTEIVEISTFFLFLGVSPPTDQSSFSKSCDYIHL